MSATGLMDSVTLLSILESRAPGGEDSRGSECLKIKNKGLAGGCMENARSFQQLTGSTNFQKLWHRDIYSFHFQYKRLESAYLS